MPDWIKGIVVIGIAIVLLMYLLMVGLMSFTRHPIEPQIYKSPYEIVEGVVDAVERVDKKHIKVTIFDLTDDSTSTLTIKAYINVDKLHLGEYYTFFIEGDELAYLYFGESSGDYSDLEMVYDQ